jgi:hypothetical protein
MPLASTATLWGSNKLAVITESTEGCAMSVVSVKTPANTAPPAKSPRVALVFMVQIEFEG